MRISQRFTGPVLAAVACAVLAAGAALPVRAQDVAQMTVTGESRVTAVPDMATVSLGAEGRGESAQAAMDATSAAVEAIIAELSDLGLEDADIQTRDLSVTEETKWNRERDEQIFVGYFARNMIDIRVRDMDKLGDILGAVLGKGATRLGGISFSLQDDAPLRAEARTAAVRDAMDKAKLFAEAAEVRVGRVVSIRDSGTAQPEGPVRKMAEPMMLEAADARSVPVAVGETAVRSEVTMVFEILQ
ncbi:SIMPL domain-containing protein [Sagittula sp. SSi028]|uniref:SIMPL domain-containing protein n=1 Tax=Sagittula sp. SSi028 TaxID=3400636 RepID=UPI003AF6F3C8